MQTIKTTKYNATNVISLNKVNIWLRHYLNIIEITTIFLFKTLVFKMDKLFGDTDIGAS